MLKILCFGKKIITQCCSCQRIRNDNGDWQDPGEVGLDNNNTLFSHSVCPVCLVELYPELVSAIGINL